ncbi:MAG TPA: pyridoxal-phosphate dependent enzyme, partial [Solirubrobacteraceae bacterium]
MAATAHPTVADVEAARNAVVDVVRHTPVLPSATLSERCGAPVVLKAESLQRTGSFKIRGALAKLHALGDACAPGVVTGSAGNHAQALAAAARTRGVPCEVFMPVNAPIAKIEGASALGAEVRLVGESVDECVAAARERASETGMGFVHPFDDPDVVAGQGTLGLELLEDVPDLARVVIPV